MNPPQTFAVAKVDSEGCPKGKAAGRVTNDPEDWRRAGAKAAFPL